MEIPLQHPKNTPRFLTWWQLTIIVAVSAGVTAYMWGPILKANWWIIDDHRWVNLIGNRDHLPFSEMLGQINPPDWHLGTPVNRPTYYALTAVWMFLFGKHVFLWNFAKLLCFLVGLVMFWAATTHLLRLSVAGLLTLYLGLHPLWHEIVPPGTSELYALPGCGLLLLGLSRLLRYGNLAFEKRSNLSRSRLYSATACVVCGGLLAVGSKENFTALLLMAMAPLLIIGIVRRQHPLLLASYLVVLIWGTFILNGIYHGVIQRGADIYGQSINDRLEILTEPIDITNPVVFLLILYFMLWCLSVFWTGFRRRLALSSSAVFVVLAIQVYLFLGEVFLNYFYAGNIDDTSRYGFPFVFMPALSIALLCYLLLVLTAHLSPKWQRGVITVAICVGAISVYSLPVRYNRTRSVTYARGTQAFAARLEKVVMAARNDSVTPIVFQSHGFNDCEPLVSVAIFLRSAGVRNPLYLALIGYSEETARSASERHLLLLTKAQIGVGRLFLGAAELGDGEKQIRISFSQPEVGPGVIANFWPLP